MDTSPEKYVKRLSELIDKKSGLLREIQSLTLEQSGVISEEGMDGLQGLIDAKQARIDAINKLDEEFQVYFVRLKSTLKIESLSELDASGIAGAGELKTKVGGILEQIEAISELEKKNSDASRKLLENLGGEVRKLNQGMKVSHAYGSGQSKTASYFIDKKK